MKKYKVIQKNKPTKGHPTKKRDSNQIKLDLNSNYNTTSSLKPKEKPRT